MAYPPETKEKIGMKNVCLCVKTETPLHACCQFTLGAHVKETEKNGLRKGHTGSVPFEGETAVKVHPQPSHTTYREVAHILVNLFRQCEVLVITETETAVSLHTHTFHTCCTQGQMREFLFLQTKPRAF